MIEIYVREGCPFCRKVLSATQQMGLEEGKDFATIDASPGTEGRETVMRIGGKTMVPFLTDGVVFMYESDDIIAYLEKKFHSS